MQTVKEETVITNSTIEQVWQTISDLERYPEIMADVLDVKCIERAGQMTISTWKALLNGSEMMWTERGIYEPPERITFSQVEGDMEVYQGQWLLEQTSDGVHVSLHIEFDIGIPSLAEIMDPIAKKAFAANSKQMLTAIKNNLVK